MMPSNHFILCCPLLLPPSIFPIYSFKNGNYKYKSESEAKSAAREEFRKYCYAESAYRPMLKKVFVAYKMNVLKPYFTCTDTEDSAFYVYNCQIRKLLSDTYAEIEYIMGNNTLPESWKDFSVYLPENDICVGVVANFDERSTNSGIISELKSISSLDSYVSEMDINYLEEYAGEGMFGSIKFKKKWGFDNFFAASESFVKDLTWAIGYMSSDIEDGAVSCVNSVLVEFEKKVKEELKKKISELEKCIN